MTENIYICPICKNPLFKTAGSLQCENHHSYDFSSSGYINLLKPGKKNNFKAGDSKEMIRSRTMFLNSGYYEKIRNELCEITANCKSNVIVDAGCGEGYYTEAIAKNNPQGRVIGFDISKHGVENGAKSARRKGLENISYATASIFSMPIADCTADIVINMFAPIADREFFRILKCGGHLIIGASGKEHLDGLKSILYSNVYENDENIELYEGFQCTGRQNLKYETRIIGNDTIKNLFTMTPYYFRTAPADKEKLNCIDELSTHIEVNFYIYEKIAQV